MDKGISVVIPNYNSGEYLTEAVNSVLNQNCKYEVEIIIVDDASFDLDTLAVLESFEKNLKVVVVRNKTNRGVQITRNIGIQIAKHKIVMTLDSDDCLEVNNEYKSYIEFGIEQLENFDVAFVNGVSYMFGDFNGYTISTYPVTEELAVKKHHVHTSIIYRKEDAIRAGLYDEDIKKWQDWSFAISLLNNRRERGLKNEVVYYNHISHLYRVHMSDGRISYDQVDELEMAQITIKKCMNLFSHYYDSVDETEIAQCVMANKPSRLKDLLYVANYNKKIAEDIVEQRQYNFDSFEIHKYIP